MRARRVLVLGLAVTALLGGGGGAESAITVLGNDAPSWSADGRRIAFTAFRHGRGEIYVMNADGTGQTRLTRDPSTDYLPAWSPDGTRIVWRTDRDGNAEIYVMNADGTDQRRLTNEPRADTAPDWGPNGQIVFASNRAGNPFNIYVMNEDGSNLRRVTTSQQNHDQPDWSPSGEEIVFVEDRDAALGQADIFAVRVNRASRRRITESEGRDDWPVYSPDGTRLLFTRGLSFRTPEIFVANADGSRARRLTTSRPQLEVVDASAVPEQPVAGRRWTAEILVADVRGAPLAGRLIGICAAKVGGTALRVVSRLVDAGLVRCSWAIPRAARGKTVEGSIALRVGKLRIDFPFRLRVD